MIQAPKVNPLEYDGGVWVCPVTGYEIAKTEDANLKQRNRLKALGGGAKSAEMIEVCRQSLIVWLNLWGWTYAPKKVGPDGRPAKRGTFSRHTPFITWPCQDVVLTEMVRAVEEGDDLIVDKSRDMGASWLNCALPLWLILFHQDSLCLLTSRIADDVDKTGRQKSLFWKIDYMVKRLPAWMCPMDPLEWLQDPKCRQSRLLANPKNGSAITGESTTDHIGRGDRTTLVLFDEMASHEHAAAGWDSAADTTHCRIGNSTPLGPGTEFTRQRNKGLQTGDPKVVTLGYWDHPDKGRGREWVIDHDGTITKTAGRGFWKTPWFERETRRRNPQDIAQNILIDHVASGDSFFNNAIVSAHLQNYATEPTRYEYDLERHLFKPADNGRWFIWAPINEGRIRQNTNYAAFADLAHGNGSANTAGAFVDVQTGRLVAEFVDAYTPVDDFSEQFIKAARDAFAGQTRGAFIGWEVNGPGESFYRHVTRMDYPHAYYQRQLGTRSGDRGRRTRNYGWRATRTSKRILLDALGHAMKIGEIIIPCREGLNEMMEYVFYEDGSIGPGSAKDESTGAREAHGDRVIAYAGAVFMMKEQPRYQEEVEQAPKNRLADVLGHQRVWANIDESRDQAIVARAAAETASA